MAGPIVLAVDVHDPTPPYEQLRRQIARLVLSGAVAPGERLPPLRQLAGDLRLAVGTVARAYRELETAGLVRSRRGGGTRVADPLPVGARAADGETGPTSTGPASIGPASIGRASTGLPELAARFVREARALGAGAREITTAVAAAVGADLDDSLLAPPVPEGPVLDDPEPEGPRTAAVDG